MAKLPIGGRFILFVAVDYGSNLTIYDLIDRGRTPMVDFFYPYTLLPVVFGRGWFHLFGRSPTSYLCAVVLGQLAVAWGLAWFLHWSRSGLGGVLLVILAVPHAIPAAYATLSHVGETTFLVWALAEQVRGRRGTALALAAAATLSKPSMGYVYGAVLIVLMGWRARGRWGPWIRAMLPGLGVGLALALLIAGVFSLRSLLDSQLPFQMARLYQAHGYGFFRGSGRRFWLPPDAGWRHYLGTQRGFWIVATVVLTAGGTAILSRLAIRQRGNPESLSPVAEVALTCAILHVAFLTLFFGGEVSWIYYAFVLVLGCVALAGTSVWGGRAIWLLTLLALLADRSLPREVKGPWNEVGLRPRVEGLWASEAEATEWQTLRERLRGEGRAVFLSFAGCAPTLAPDLFLPAETLYLTPGMERFPDERRVAEQIQHADVVVIPTAQVLSDRTHRLLTHDCADIRAALEPFRTFWVGEYYEILRRHVPTEENHGGDPQAPESGPDPSS